MTTLKLLRDFEGFPEVAEICRIRSLVEKCREVLRGAEKFSAPLPLSRVFSSTPLKYPLWSVARIADSRLHSSSRPRMGQQHAYLSSIWPVVHGTPRVPGQKCPKYALRIACQARQKKHKDKPLGLDTFWWDGVIHLMGWGPKGSV